MPTWGEEIWTKKSQAHSDSGVIFGTGFTRKDVDLQTTVSMPLIEETFLSRLPRGARILDAGTGPLARFSIEFAKREFQVTALDIADTVLRKAESRLKEAGVSASLVKGDISALHEVGLNETFDGVFCFETFFHVPAHRGLITLKEFNHVLVKGGLAYVQFAILEKLSVRYLLNQLAYHSAYAALRPVFAGLGKKTFYVTVARYTTDEVKDMATLCGFEIIDVRDQKNFLLKKIGAPTF